MEMGDSETELRLGLPGTEIEKPLTMSRSYKRKLPTSEEGRESEGNAPAAKAQIVGWPPIRSHMKNCIAGRIMEEEVGRYVKVRMDGAPYMRKVDLNSYKGYEDLGQALKGLFSRALEGLCDEENKSRVEINAITYEDKDGDWMLAGDVPWGMFKSTCKRLRIMELSGSGGLCLPARQTTNKRTVCSQIWRRGRLGTFPFLLPPPGKRNENIGKCDYFRFCSSKGR